MKVPQKPFVKQVLLRHKSVRYAKVRDLLLVDISGIMGKEMMIMSVKVIFLDVD